MYKFTFAFILALSLCGLAQAQQFNTTDGTTYQTDDSAFKSTWDAANDLYKLQAATVGTAGNTIIWSDALTIDADGNIGIGKTDPAYILDIAGEVGIRGEGGTGVGRIRFSDSTGNIGSASISGNNGGAIVLGGNTLDFAVTQFRSSSNITWGLGNRSFTIKSTGGSSFVVEGGNTATVPMVLKAATSQTANLMEWRNSSNTALGTIASNGNVGIGTNAPSATLDVDGFAKLASNSSAPATCDSNIAGSIALTSSYEMCVCDGSNWEEVNTSTACSW